MRINELQRWIVAAVIAGSSTLCLAGEKPLENYGNLPSRKSPTEIEKTVTVTGYTRDLLTKAGHNDVVFRVVKELGHDEAFRVVKKDNHITIEHQTAAGALYGAQAVIREEYELEKVEKPDHIIRGTTLCLMSGGNAYKSTLSPKIFPWFYDKEFMTRTLDTFAEARMNTIFLWAGHIFPYIVEMPDYPEAAANVPLAQVKANQEQFRWFTSECEKRNIRVLMHFYNIHVSEPFAFEHNMPTNPHRPTPLLKEYTRYALGRYFAEFPQVGLYACPGESLESQRQLGWFRDVIFKAAKDSGKNPIIVIRDWTLNMDFQEQLKSLYSNVYSELKHNDESVTTPYPDVRHVKWEGLARGHIINAVHGPAEDLQPMRWASPVFVQEMTQRWKALGFVSGIEFWGLSYWQWPYTFDKLSGKEPKSVVAKKKRKRLLSIDRDAAFYAVAGRYLWASDRDSEDEQAFWKRYFAKKYASEEIGERMFNWYVVSGSISPGLQNLNATKVGNFWATVLLMNQKLDQILTYNKNLSETPYTLYRETGRAGQRYYPRPFDSYFFKRYQKEYGAPEPGKQVEMYDAFASFKKRMGVDNLEQRHCMPVSQYAAGLESGKTTFATMTPDNVVLLLHKLATESLALAESMEAACTDPALKPELHRFVTDSQMYVLATQAMIHKENAAILKARMLLSKKADKADEFLREMEGSVKVYKKLAKLTKKTYHFANGLLQYHWSAEGIREFYDDLDAQQKWLKAFKTADAFAPPPAPEYFAKVDPAMVETSEYFSNWPAGKSPAEIGRKVSENFLSRGHYQSYKVVVYPEVCTWYGAFRVARQTGDNALAEQLIRRFDPYLKHENLEKFPYIFHVDFCVNGVVPIEIYRLTKEKLYLKLGMKRADYQWGRGKTTADGITRQARYWVDDIYMISAIQTSAYRVTGEMKYLDRAALTTKAYLDKLQQPDGLFFHAADSPFYWGRGVGWFAAGITEILRSLPEDHPHYAPIMKSYQKMMVTLLKHQSESGLWRQLVDKPEAWHETSCTGMFAYSMVTGVKRGWLDEKTYGPVVRKAWLALVDNLDENYNMKNVCVGTGKAYQVVGTDLDAQYEYYLARPSHTGDYHGQAALLWTAAAMLE